VIGQRVRPVHEYDALEDGRDTKTVQNIVDGASVGNVDDRGAVAAVGWKKTGERCKEPDFDDQR
jgi:hypothetical protein